MELKYVMIVVVFIVVILVIKFGKSQPSIRSATEADIEAALENGNKVLAIKYYREVHGVGLKEAKTAVDALAAK